MWKYRALALVALLNFEGPIFANEGIALGTCDASAVEFLVNNQFVVGSDEDEILRVYSLSAESALEVQGSFVVFRGEEEADIEASTRLGEKIFWITSHGTKRKGKRVSERQVLIATSFGKIGEKLQVEINGEPYRDLITDLASHNQFIEWANDAYQPTVNFIRNLTHQRADGYDEEDLAKVKERLGSLQTDEPVTGLAGIPPKLGGLNIEGLTSTPEGTLLVGFRSPAPHNSAALIEILNPAAILAGSSAEFGNLYRVELPGPRSSTVTDPTLGIGIRSIERIPGTDTYLIAFGHVGSTLNTRLFRWTRTSNTLDAIEIDFGDLNVEAMAPIPTSAGEWLFLSDDGSRPIGSTDCKKSHAKAFRFIRAKILSE